MFEYVVSMYQYLLEPVVTIGWPLSILDFILLGFNLTCVYLVGKNNILNYPIGIVAIVAYMFMCFSLGFYSEFFLQIYFFFASIIGWYMWRTNASSVLNPHYVKLQSFIGIIVIWVLGSYILGSNIDMFFQQFVEFISPVLSWLNGEEVVTYIHEPAAFPYIDAFTTVGQVIAMILMMRKIIESWYIWIAIDVVSIPMFYIKGGYSVSIMFAVFLCLAVIGLFRWIKIENELNTH